MKSGKPESTPQYRVLLVDPDAAFGLHLADVLRDSNRFRGLEHVLSLAAAPASIAANEPDLVIVDIDANTAGALELLRSLTSTITKRRTLATSLGCGPSESEQVFRAGAQGLLLKSDTPDEILNACTTVMSGQIYVSRSFTMPLLKRLLNDAYESAAEGLESLTDREWRVFELLGFGLSTREVAGRLGLSAKTVNNHLSKIQHRLGVNSAEALAQYAFAKVQLGMGGRDKPLETIIFRAVGGEPAPSLRSKS